MTIEKMRKPIILTDKSDIAKAINFSKYPVLTYDIDNKKGSVARVGGRMTESGMMYKKTTLYRDKIKEGDGIFYLLTSAAMLKGHYGVDDHLKAAEYANAPIIESNQEVAILLFSKELDVSVVMIVQAGKVDGSYSTACEFFNTGEPIE